MVHSNVGKFEKIWLSGTNYYPETKSVTNGRTDMRGSLFTPDSGRAGIKGQTTTFKTYI
jgi:hypothetical protein